MVQLKKNFFNLIKDTKDQEKVEQINIRGSSDTSYYREMIVEIMVPVDPCQDFPDFPFNLVFLKTPTIYLINK